MARLASAYHGYNHQDLVAAYAMAELLVPRSAILRVSAERKAIKDDCFDDIELSGDFRRRAQVKSHVALGRSLQVDDFTTERMDFRIDRAVLSFSQDSLPADSYVLFTTFPVDAELLPFLRSAQSTTQLLSGIETKRFGLEFHQIWPKGEKPVWRALDSLDRDTFAAFCGRFTVEAGCPQASGDLRLPGPLEDALLRVLRDGIGIGLFPNNSRDVADAAAHLIYSARALRAESGTADEGHVIRALALKIDYGRVPEEFPVSPERMVHRADVLETIADLLDRSKRLAVTGSPGVGKSWLVRQLRAHLRDAGWTVATHYCFTGLFDTDRYLRASVSTTFGSIIAELYDADQSLLPSEIPRFAAGPVELERILQAGAETNPDRRIAIIVDGLDHVDRLPGRSTILTAEEIIGELAALRLPERVAVIVVSQPGKHLDTFLSIGAEYVFAQWPDDQIRALVHRSELARALQINGIDTDFPSVLQAIVYKAAGNPLYATYLVRTAVNLAKPVAVSDVADIAEFLQAAPPLDTDLEAYYAWLVDGISADVGAMWVAETLALLDFPVSADELKQIRPDFKHHIEVALARLAPVLAEDVARGGVRIYHESFQRFVRRRLEGAPDSDVPAILGPIITWLEERGFYSDLRAFRSLFGLLEKAGREQDIPARVSADFLTLAVACAQPGDAVLSNLAMAARVAASTESWPILAQLLETARACDYLYRWRFHSELDLAEEYGRAYAAVFGTSALSDRLLHDGRCTFLPRPGLTLCRLCDVEGTIPPWQEYLLADAEARKADNTLYDAGSQHAMALARLTGLFRIDGRPKSMERCIRRLGAVHKSFLSAYDVLTELARMYGADAVAAVSESLQPGPSRAWARFVLAEWSDSPDDAKEQAERALADGLPLDAWRPCLRLGADPANFPESPEDLGALTERVVAKEIQFHPEPLHIWLTELELAAARGKADSLGLIQLRITPDTWYRRWLLFCVSVAKSRPTSVLLNELKELSENVGVFKGEPRVCDLLHLHGEIRDSFRKMLVKLDDQDWATATEILASISKNTTTYLRGSRDGPIPLDAMLDLCSETADTPNKRYAARDLAARVLEPTRRSAEYYDTHARDSLLLTRIQRVAGNDAEAKAAWADACKYLVAYGWHKDITIYEILDPIVALGDADPVRTRRCLAALQQLVENVAIHTDGKETAHAIHKWIDSAARIHPEGALSLIAREEISNIPAFRDLDHAIPDALTSLRARCEALPLSCGWLAIGSDAKSKPEAAIEACEGTVAADPELGERLWQAVLASLEGDGISPPKGLREIAVASADRLSFAVPNVEPDRQTSNDDKGASNWQGEQPHLQEAIPPFLVPTTPLQIASAVRKWRDSTSNRPAADSIVNAVGWKILEFLDNGNSSAAELVIRSLARDSTSRHQDPVLPALAEGLELRGYSHLAAITNTLAYANARDGWGRFGGSLGTFHAALNIDGRLAWSTFADELAQVVAFGGSSGATTRLVELLVAGGRIGEAFDCWETAYRVIASRIPWTGPEDDVTVPYDSDSEKASSALSGIIAARMNSLFISEKRLAVAAAAVLARFKPHLFGEALSFAVTNQAPPWTLTLLLQILFMFEAPPYEATTFVSSTLKSIAADDLVSCRILAQLLLGRCNLPAFTPPPKELPVLYHLDDKRARFLSRHVGKDRIRRIRRVWPGFEQYALGQIDAAYRSDAIRHRMARVLDRFRLQREGRRQEIWYPIDEEVESILQRTGAAVRCGLARDGVVDSSMEMQLGMALLQDIETMVRVTLSRIVRPNWAESLSPGKTGMQQLSEPLIIHSDEFAGWVVAGFRETQLDLGSLGAVKNRHTVYGGLVFDRAFASSNTFPFATGDPRTWSEGEAMAHFSEALDGPVAGYQRTNDAFGEIETFVPHPFLLAVGRLKATEFSQGLTLIDPDGKPAIVCRNWRRALIGIQYFDDFEHRTDGLALLIRRDIFTMASSSTTHRARFATVILNEEP
jgi:hypothetical protein